MYEHRVGVAVDHGYASGLERVARAVQDLLAEPRDRVGDRRVEEAARRGAEHAEQRVHHDLDCLVGVAIASSGLRSPTRSTSLACGSLRETCTRCAKLASPARACASGSSWNVRIRLGYRLLKSNTATSVNSPGTESSTAPPCTSSALRSGSTLGAANPRRRSSGRYRRSNE